MRCAHKASVSLHGSPPRFTVALLQVPKELERRLSYERRKKQGDTNIHDLNFMQDEAQTRRELFNQDRKEVAALHSARVAEVQASHRDTPRTNKVPCERPVAVVQNQLLMWLGVRWWIR